MRTETEVDSIIEDMIMRTKGKYITQAVAFNKSCPRQMRMLKQALVDSVSFSGLVKEMIAIRFEEKPTASDRYEKTAPPNNHYKEEASTSSNTKNVGNFI